MMALGAGVMAVALQGCDDDKAPPPTPPAATYQGKPYLYGTVGSLTSLRGYEPLYVSGYGLVVGLEGTGSTSTPTYIRSWMTTYIRRMGFGTEKFRQYQSMSPERILASGTASVVVIEGLIPPGAPRGTLFDTLVTALPGTQTSSLRNGFLYTFDLSIDGANPRLLFTRPLARAGGDVYLDPLDPPSKNAEARMLDERMGVVLSGGVATENRKLELLLNQPSWGRSVMIAQAINNRFPPPVLREENFYAKAFNDQIINIKIPDAYANHPERFLDLISYVYVQVAPNGEGEVAQQMAKILAKDPKQARSVTLVWIGLGKLALPIVQQYYDSKQRHMQLAALEAGVRMGDSSALGDAENKTRIIGLSMSEDPDDRILSARLLLPKSDLFKAQVALKKLLDDPEKKVRIAAYETLAETGDDIIQRQTVGDPTRFILDLVPSSQSMIYITQKDYPRVVIFNPMLGFKNNTIASVWDNRLMLRTQGQGEVATIFYQRPGEIDGETLKIAPAVGNLVYAMGQKPSSSNTDPGFGMTYSQVVGALKEMHVKGYIDCEWEVFNNPLSDIVKAARKTNPFEPRKETDEESDTQPSDTQPTTGPSSTQPTTRPARRAAPQRDETDAIPQATPEAGGIMSNTPSTKDISPSDAWDKTDPSR